MAKNPRVDRDALHRGAQEAVLAGLVRGDDVEDIVAAVAPNHVAGRFSPDVALLDLAVTALELATPPGSAPLEYDGLRERFLPEIQFRGRVEHRNSQYALYAAACRRGGLEPDLLRDAGWWQEPLWIYAAYAVVIYARAAGERLGLPPAEIARRVGGRHRLDVPAAG